MKPEKGAVDPLSILKNKFPHSAFVFQRIIKLEEDNIKLNAEMIELKEVIFPFFS
jgi:hypothetical protein